MFDIGFTEIVLVAVIGLLILGPERMPVAVRTIGLWVGKIKRTVSGVQKEIRDELRVDEIRKKADENRKAIEGRMAELQAETDIMEAPVVAAQENQPVKKPVKKVVKKAVKKPTQDAEEKPAKKSVKKVVKKPTLGVDKKTAKQPVKKSAKNVEQKDPSIGGS
ncbi:Sec-independent protein translocase protein TatB [Oceanospirillaceae bacterium]|jgi:sec-independent protein translocase protein TatB|nr:twin-arginine translocase subunit TatB [Oceanospirillaceae bacterium]MBT4998321.1 twin-arginine translocase subunit TatB [Oceanospirillaceae bacterium]MBT5628970.1 twin-arginine translocase subunit TatB [Oceanospirillaceae bacterium]MBT6101530.1 twin-arginine translocase subunit TatB [Oceanospirillaceae bacterium]MDB0065420.1 Sec-independent protein translocase protein TatB [Oceanospirillaceae bacterium]|tara:strand:- start:127 stop:615 length:489 start_codon:yes stop_codon:yes gene_type:complete